MSKLKPCPFCGGEAELTGFDAPEFWVWCPNCKASTDAHTCKGGAIEAWNTRYDQQLDAIPATEENMARYGWVRERTCQLDYERHCSNCGVYVRDEAVLVRKDLDDGGWTAVPKPVNYCPNCGAKVVSE